MASSTAASFRMGDIELARCTPTIGVTVSGASFHDGISARDADTLRRALHEHGVLVLRDQRLDDSAHKRLARVFGEVHSFPNSVGWDDPEILVLDSATIDPKRDGTARWHTDASFEEQPPSASLLRAVVLPEVGGDTMFSSMYAAHDSLSPPLQGMLEELEAEHDNSVYLGHAMTSNALITATHPVVIRDPVTGRRALYVNSQYTKRLVGLTSDESAAVLRFLFEHVASPEFTMRVDWRPGTVVVWDERVTQHCAVPTHIGPRVLKRVTVKGERLHPGGR
jgi:taurine dioxygenase